MPSSATKIVRYCRPLTRMLAVSGSAAEDTPGDAHEPAEQLGVARGGLREDRAFERAVGPHRARNVLGREVTRQSREESLRLAAIFVHHAQQARDVDGAVRFVPAI